jgi:ribosomal protein L29
MKTRDLKTKSGAELERLLSEKREALKGFRFNISGSKRKNVKESKNDKKDIARILTILADKSAK